jgi:hypothetical protein
LILVSGTSQLLANFAGIGTKILQKFSNGGGIIPHQCFEYGGA